MEFLQQILGLFVDLVRQFTWRDAVDVLAVSFIIYSGIKLVRESRAEQLVKGLLLVVVIFGLANYLQLYMLKGLLSTFFQFTIVALLIVFQPELRRALEQMGRNGVSKPFTLAAARKDAEAELQLQRKGILAVGEACMTLQKLKMGALIVFERKTKLKEIVDTGTVVNAEPTAAIIGNIFFNKAPLHDGAMVMRDGMVYAAGCIQKRQYQYRSGYPSSGGHRHERKFRRSGGGGFGRNRTDLHCGQRNPDPELYQRNTD